MEFFNNPKANLFLNLLLVYFLWGSTYLGMKIGLEDLSPFLLTGTRFLIGGVLLLIITIVFTKNRDFSHAKGSLLIGGILSGVGSSSMCFGINYIPSSIVSLFVAALPIYTLGLDYFFFSKKKPSLASILGLSLGFCGIVLLFNPFGTSHDVGREQLFPILVILFGSISWAYGSLISHKTPQAPGFLGVSLQLISGGIIAIILSMVLESGQIEELKSIHVRSFWAIVYLIIFGSYIGYTAFIWLINNAPPILASSYAYVNPVVALILGFYIGHEKLSILSILASIILLSGVVLMTIGKRKVR
jgi:drug/metabolite transporter (DMT)-like permease